MTEAVYPVWPGESWETLDGGLVAAVAESDPGAFVVGHQSGCALRRDEDCDCVPTVIVVQKGLA